VLKLTEAVRCRRRQCPQRNTPRRRAIGGLHREVGTTKAYGARPWDLWPELILSQATWNSGMLPCCVLRTGPFFVEYAGRTPLTSSHYGGRSQDACASRPLSENERAVLVKAGLFAGATAVSVGPGKLEVHHCSPSWGKTDVVENR
jgi:hypothetical protein